MKHTEEATLELTEKVADIMVNELFENKSFKSGDLARSIKKNNFVRDTPNGMIGIITMLWYGKVVDSGVRGSVNDSGYNKKSISGQPYSPAGQFKSRVVAPSSGLPTPVRWSLARHGFAPKPFINKSANLAEQKYGAKIMNAGVEADINEGVMNAYNKK